MNEGGTLILHSRPQLTWTGSHPDYCGEASLSACSLAVTTVPSDGPIRVLHVLAAFPPSSSPRLKAISWGIAYDPSRVTIPAWGPCGTGEFDLPDNGWPADGTGIGQSWTLVRTSDLNELYWFAAYLESPADTACFRLMPHPLQGGVMVDDGEPPDEDLIAEFGRIGFGQPGYLPCPEGEGGGEEGGGDQAGGDGLPDEPGGEGGGEQEGEGAGGDSYPGQEEEAPPELRTNLVSLCIDHLAIRLGTRGPEPSSISEIEYLHPDLRLALEATGARVLAPSFPDIEPGTVTAPDFRGRLVTVPDLSRFYTGEFGTYEDARDAIPVLSVAAGVQDAHLVTNLQTMNTPTDAYFHDFPAWLEPECPSEDCTLDPQWHLRNRGLRPGIASCDDAVAGQDISAAPWSYWPLPPSSTPYTMLGVIDTGIGFEGQPDVHEDLDLVPLTMQQRFIFRNHPMSAW